MKAVVVIPARYDSSRLHGKVLAEICGKPMVQYVYKASLKAKLVNDVYIATDSAEVKKACELFTKNIIMTSASHKSGTDRISEAVEKIDCDLVINVQADEPLVDPKLIDLLIQKLYTESNEIVSAMHKIAQVDDLKSPNSVKVVVDKHNNALYFSRSIIPYNREGLKTLLNYKTIPELFTYYKHIGIYGYKKSFLKEYIKMEQTELEKLEKLEQLRILENGYKINMIETDYIPIGVDTQEDLEQVRNIIKCK